MQDKVLAKLNALHEDNSKKVSLSQVSAMKVKFGVVLSDCGSFEKMRMKHNVQTKLSVSARMAAASCIWLQPVHSTNFQQGSSWCLATESRRRWAKRSYRRCQGSSKVSCACSGVLFLPFCRPAGSFCLTPVIHAYIRVATSYCKLPRPAGVAVY